MRSRMGELLHQETLAEMVGTRTRRSRVNVFLNKFKKLGFIDYDGEQAAHSDQRLAPESVVLHD